MKFQILSLVCVAAAAMARPVPTIANVDPTADLARRTLIGDEYKINNQIDNSRGKKTLNIDHNGSDSSAHTNGLVFDMANDDKDDEDRSFLKRRSLLGDLFGSKSTSIENINDNSQHTQTKNSHGNRNTKITKIRKESSRPNRGGSSGSDFFDKRDENKEGSASDASLARRGLLLGSDRTTISNVNDNTRHTKTLNSHNNKHTKITKIRKDTRDHRRGSGDGFFEKRGILWGDDSTTISNINDNSEHKQIMNSHHNRDTTIRKSASKYRAGRHGRRSDDQDETQAASLERRGILGGGDDLTISNENYNGKETKTLNSHDNVSKDISHTQALKSGGEYQDEEEEEEGEGFFDDEDEDSFFSKRSDDETTETTEEGPSSSTTVTVTRTTVEFHPETDGADNTKVENTDSSSIGAGGGDGDQLTKRGDVINIQIINHNSNEQNNNDHRVTHPTVNNPSTFSTKTKTPSHSTKDKTKKKTKQNQKNLKGKTKTKTPQNGSRQKSSNRNVQAPTAPKRGH